MSLTPNCIVSFCTAFSNCDMGSRKSSRVTIPTSFSPDITTMQLMSWSCIFFSAAFRVVCGSTEITGRLMIPLTGILSVSIFSPTMSPVVVRRWGQYMFSIISCTLTMPTSFPLSVTGMWDIPNSRIKLRTAPTLRFASIIWGALVMIVSI